MVARRRQARQRGTAPRSSGTDALRVLGLGAKTAPPRGGTRNATVPCNRADRNRPDGAARPSVAPAAPTAAATVTAVATPALARSLGAGSRRVTENAVERLQLTDLAVGRGVVELGHRHARTVRATVRAPLAVTAGRATLELVLARTARRASAALVGRQASRLTVVATATPGFARGVDEVGVEAVEARAAVVAARAILARTTVLPTRTALFARATLVAARAILARPP
jgi:hypothetical protein